MQNTRLTQLLTASTSRLGQWFRQPWRRLSAQIISLLAGFFLGSVLSTTAGQAAQWDISVAGITILTTELISRWVYANKATSLDREILNCLKIGTTYSLFLEAFKLGS